MSKPLGTSAVFVVNPLQFDLSRLVVYRIGRGRAVARRRRSSVQLRLPALPGGPIRAGRTNASRTTRKRKSSDEC